MHILLIEDDRRLTSLLQRVLGAVPAMVDVAYDGAAGLDLALQGLYDLIILDWMLPYQDGPAICRMIRRARPGAAILMLSARDQVEDRVVGLDSGADDYLAKPFAFAELLARVRALQRRATPVDGGCEEIRAGTIVLDLTAHQARRGSAPLDLTVTEWNLLECFVRHPRQTLTRDQILDYVWSRERDVQAKMVDVYVSYLRRKLIQAEPADPIQTVRGVGYRLVPDHV